MQKHKENLFSAKFHLLDSQETVEDIKWSSSDTSDVENLSRVSKCSNLSNKVRRKRKRKKTGPKNISNLSITILDTAKDHSEINNAQISPILQRKEASKVPKLSPTFPPTPKYYRPQKSSKNQPSSPVLTCKVLTLSEALNVKSPILYSKHNSPKVSPNIRKKLFQLTQNEPKVKVLGTNKNVKKTVIDRRRSEDLAQTLNTCTCIIMRQENKSQKNNLDKLPDDVITPPSSSAHNFRGIKIEIPESQEDITKTTRQDFTLLNTEVNSEQVKHTKSYFESHFSSENASQTLHSISDCPTQQDHSKSSDDVEIITISTQINSNRSSFQSDTRLWSKNPSPISSQSAEYGAEKSKKIRYKKDGLAHRLNALLKKQNANISLWQHERYLADNSNFVIPKGEHVVFLIQKVTVKFGCYLLDCIDVNDSAVLILISSIYVQDSNISQNMIFKLYEPYKILSYGEDCALIVNVCKFECTAFKEY